MTRLSTRERVYWECQTCDGVFLVNEGVTPNFCPYCRQTKLRRWRYTGDV